MASTTGRPTGRRARQGRRRVVAGGVDGVAASSAVVVVTGANGPVDAAVCRAEVVSKRLGHATATTARTVHQRVHPGTGREAADCLAALRDA
jgi:hypothetical protein